LRVDEPVGEGGLDMTDEDPTLYDAWLWVRKGRTWPPGSDDEAAPPRAPEEPRQPGQQTLF